MGQSASQPKSSPCEYESESDSDCDSQESSPSQDNVTKYMEKDGQDIDSKSSTNEPVTDESSNGGSNNRANESPQDIPEPIQPLHDVLSMSDDQLKLCIQKSELTRENIITRSTLLEDDMLGVFGWYHDFIQINKVDGTVDDTGRSHTEVAMFLLSVSPELRSIRFKMVPAKLSECHFWGSVFSLLQDTGPKSQQSKTYVTESKQISDTILEKDREIALLKRKLAAAEKALDEMKNSNLRNGASGEMKEISRNPSKNRGKWVMDKDCQEFLSLDKETREKLREAKKKRLDDVREQMKFILDGDDESYSRGYWDGNGQTSYY